MLDSYELSGVFGNLPKDIFLKFKEISELKTFEANFQLDEIGKIPSKLYLVLNGVMRCYITSESGKEFNKRFFFPMDFAGSLTALIKNAPSEIAYETITRCDIYEIDYKKLTEMCNTDIVISNFYASILENIFMKYEKRQLELISLDASQRYKKLKNDIPDIDELIPQYHIASYLSITPVQLSRIRRKLKES